MMTRIEFQLVTFVNIAPKHKGWPKFNCFESWHCLYLFGSVDFKNLFRYVIGFLRRIMAAPSDFILKISKYDSTSSYMNL